MKYQNKLIRQIEWFRFRDHQFQWNCDFFLCIMFFTWNRKKKKNQQIWSRVWIYLKLLTDVEIRLCNELLFNPCCTTICDYRVVCIVRIKKVHLTLEFRIQNSIFYFIKLNNKCLMICVCVFCCCLKEFSLKFYVMALYFIVSTLKA